jgi:tetratricopeptide (TPR) repeat protein
MADIDVNEDFNPQEFREKQESKKTSDLITMKIHPEIWEELGVRDPEQIKLETAIMKKTRQIKKELRTDPDNSEKQIELATLYIDGGNYEDAIKILRGVISKDSKNPRAYKVIGTAYALSKQEDEAILELNRAAELDPDDIETHFNLGGVYMLQDSFGNAEREFKRVIGRVYHAEKSSGRNPDIEKSPDVRSGEQGTALCSE